MNRSVIIVACAIVAATSQYAADVRHLTLTEAVHLAIKQNRVLRIARLRVAESQQKKAGERSAYFPSLKNESHISHLTALQDIGIPAGAFGLVGGSEVPSRNTIIPQGQTTIYSSGTTLSEPLTQLIRIHDENRMAAADVAISKDDQKKAENEIALQVHSVYYGILIARLQKQAAEQQTKYADQDWRESEDDVRNGSALKVTAIQGRATLLQSRQAVLTADLQLTDLTTQLNDLLGLPLDTQLDLDSAVPAVSEERSRDAYVQTAWSQNPQIKAAEDTVAKARAAVGSAKTAYIPEVSAFASQHYQDGIPFFVRNFGTFGITSTWEVFDFGKRRAALRESEDQLAEAEENVSRLKEEVAVTIQRSYDKLQRTRSLVEVAQEVVHLRQESERLAQNQLVQGVALISDRRQATAETYKAQADLLQANLGYLLAWAELQESAGITPGF